MVLRPGHTALNVRHVSCVPDTIYAPNSIGSPVLQLHDLLVMLSGEFTVYTTY